MREDLIAELRELCAIEGRPLTVGERARTKIAMSAAAAALREAPAGFVLVPVEVVEVCWNVIDNLSDPPINDDWARRTADRLIQLLDEGPQEAKP